MQMLKDYFRENPPEPKRAPKPMPVAARKQRRATQAEARRAARKARRAA